MEINVDQRGLSENHNGLPGFRFHPTEQELVGFYLKRMVQGKLQNFNYIQMLELYRYDPWDLPSFYNFGERELFFFVPRDERCQNNRGRPNRITASGYWKATGSDRSVREDNCKCIGLKKTLVFYRGRAPLGQKTDWIMNEYRLPDYIDKPKVEVVLCRIYRKATPQKWLEQKAMSQAEVNSTCEDFDCISQDSQLSPPKIAKFADNKFVHEAKSICVRDSDSLACHEITTEPSSSQQDNLTKSDITSSLGRVVDSDLNNLMESTVYGGFIDPVFRALADESMKIEGFSSLTAMLNASAASSSVESWDRLLIPAMAEDPPNSVQIPKLSMDFRNEEAGNRNLQNPWADLWSPSSIICTPHFGPNSSVDCSGHGGL